MKAVICIYIALFQFQQAFSQNIYDKENSLKYADFLYSSGEFNDASLEYERVLSFVPNSFYVRERLILSYMKAFEYQKCNQRLTDIFGTMPASYPTAIFNVYIQLLIIRGDYNSCETLITGNTLLPKSETPEYMLALLLLQKKWNEAQGLIDSVQTDTLNSISPKFDRLCLCLQNALKTDYKKPGPASALSVIIPGAGKAYADDLQNGLRSFTIIGLYAWQSYRGFNKEGIKSVYGWAFGAIAAGFYSANIYGSYVSAKRTNNYYDKRIQKEVKEIILNKDFYKN